jgi:hypothetical protein
VYAYPLQLRFTLLALAPQIRAVDAQGCLVGYVRQKLLELREQVTVFADEGKTRPLYFLEADRVIDWSAQYAIRRADGSPVGTFGGASVYIW